MLVSLTTSESTSEQCHKDLMSHIHIERIHHLDRTRLRQRIEVLADQLEKEYKTGYQWHDHKITLQRTGARGYIELEDEIVVIDIKLGGLMRPLTKKMESMINEYLDKHLA